MTLADLALLLDAPVEALRGPKPEEHVWHVSVRNHADDRCCRTRNGARSPPRWGTPRGVAEHGDEQACRWIAVRHADDYHSHPGDPRPAGRPAPPSARRHPQHAHRRPRLRSPLGPHPDVPARPHRAPTAGHRRDREGRPPRPRGDRPGVPAAHRPPGRRARTRRHRLSRPAPRRRPARARTPGRRRRPRRVLGRAARGPRDRVPDPSGSPARRSPTTCPCPASANASPHSSPRPTGRWPNGGSAKRRRSWAAPGRTKAQATSRPSVTSCRSLPRTPRPWSATVSRRRPMPSSRPPAHRAPAASKAGPVSVGAPRRGRWSGPRAPRAGAAPRWC